MHILSPLETRVGYKRLLFWNRVTAGNRLTVRFVTELPMSPFRWLNTKLQDSHCYRIGDTAALH